MAKQRCGRSYINIGILAPWRHGKSQFLCKVFRLKAEEEKYLIPTDGDKQRACTGTTVNYQNGEENKCEFEVFSEDEIIEAILDLCKLCEIPTENIKSRSLSELVDFINKNYSSKIENVNEKTAPQALKEYVVGYPHYGPIVAKGSIDPITFELDKDVIDSRLSEIYKYICFYSSPTETNKHNNFRCLGIKKVSISMPLKSVDGESLGKIRFLDTPGLGESRPNVWRKSTPLMYSAEAVGDSMQRVVGIRA